MGRFKFDSPPINKKQAIQIVRDIIKDFELLERDTYIVIEEETIEKEWGWVIFYSSKKWLETNDLRYAIAGNAPYIVLRKNGKVLETGTACTIDHYINAHSYQPPKEFISAVNEINEI